MRVLLFKLSFPFFAISAFMNPFSGVLLYTGMNIIRPEMLFWGGRQNNIIFKITLLATLLGFLFRCQRQWWKPARIFEVWLILWVAIAVKASMLFSVHEASWRVDQQSMGFLILGVLIWILAGTVTGEERIFQYQNLILFLFSLLALWGIAQKLQGNVRVEGLSGWDSNELASLFVLVTPLAVNFTLNGKGKKMKALGILSLSILTSGIIATMSRGGALGLIACITIAFKRASSKIAVVLVLSVVVFGAAFFFASDDFSSRMSTISSGNGQRDVSSGSRLVLWEAGLMVFMDNPFFGSGFLTFPQAKQMYSGRFNDENPDLVEYSFQGFKVGHNTYVQALSEGGLFLAVPYFLLIIRCLFKDLMVIGKFRHNEECKKLLNLLASVDAGIIGHCVSITFIDALVFIFLPIQIVSAAIIRDEIEKKAAFSNKSSALHSPLKVSR